MSRTHFEEQYQNATKALEAARKRYALSKRKGDEREAEHAKRESYIALGLKSAYYHVLRVIDETEGEA